MTDFQKCIIALVCAAVTGKPAVLLSDFDWERALKFAKKHSIIPLIYYGAMHSGTEIPEGVAKHMELATYNSVSVDQNQLYCINKLVDAFKADSIDFVLLKGAVIKPLYKKTEMRTMGDADILIKTEQYERIVPIMNRLGYLPGVESNHEYVWDKKNMLHVELHKMLIPSYNKDYYAYFGDGWRLAKKYDGSEFKMSDEDTFVYIFTHFAKHYRDAGIGIRHITDIYVYLKAKPGLDMQYIKRELKKLQLLQFFTNVVQTLNVWFENGTETEPTKHITRFIFESGVYGTYDKSVISEAVKQTEGHSVNGGKLKLFISNVFPSFKRMSSKYSILNKLPFLLPVFWVTRWFSLLFARGERRSQIERKRTTVTRESVENYRNELKLAGLKFNFKE